MGVEAIGGRLRVEAAGSSRSRVAVRRRAGRGLVQKLDDLGGDRSRPRLARGAARSVRRQHAGSRRDGHAPRSARLLPRRPARADRKRRRRWHPRRHDRRWVNAWPRGLAVRAFSHPSLTRSRCLSPVTKTTRTCPRATVQRLRSTRDASRTRTCSGRPCSSRCRSDGRHRPALGTGPLQRQIPRVPARPGATPRDRRSAGSRAAVFASGSDIESRRGKTAAVADPGRPRSPQDGSRAVDDVGVTS